MQPIHLVAPVALGRHEGDLGIERAGDAEYFLVHFVGDLVRGTSKRLVSHLEAEPGQQSLLTHIEQLKLDVIATACRIERTDQQKVGTGEAPVRVLWNVSTDRPGHQVLAIERSEVAAALEVSGHDGGHVCRGLTRAAEPERYDGDRNRAGTALGDLDLDHRLSRHAGQQHGQQQRDANVEALPET